MQKAKIQLETLTCPSCMQKIIDNVNELTGIETIKILFDRRSKLRSRSGKGFERNGI